MAGEDYAALVAKQSAVQVGVGKAVRFRPMMKNVNEGKGVFAPLVVVARNIIGKKRFNQLRGKAIALHSQVLIFYYYYFFNLNLLVFKFFIKQNIMCIIYSILP